MTRAASQDCQINSPPQPARDTRKTILSFFERNQKQIGLPTSCRCTAQEGKQHARSRLPFGPHPGAGNLANAIMEQATDIENVIDEMPDEVPDADGKSRPAAYMAG